MSAIERENQTIYENTQLNIRLYAIKDTRQYVVTNGSCEYTFASLADAKKFVHQLVLKRSMMTMHAHKKFPRFPVMSPAAKMGKKSWLLS